jgi:hypothetical protein
MGQTSRARGLARLFKAAFEFEKVGGAESSWEASANLAFALDTQHCRSHGTEKINDP